MIAGMVPWSPVWVHNRHVAEKRRDEFYRLLVLLRRSLAPGTGTLGSGSSSRSLRGRRRNCKSSPSFRPPPEVLGIHCS